MKSTTPKLGTCDRCKKLVFTCWVDGLTTVVDVQPLDAINYRVALIAKQYTFDVRTDSTGKPVKLTPRNQFSIMDKWNIVRQHGCRLVSVALFEVTDAPKVSTPVSFSSVGKDIATDYSKATQESVATNATQSRSDWIWKPALCCECRAFFTAEEIEQALFVGYYLSSSQWWACHSEGCPKPPPRKGWVRVGRRFSLDGNN